MNRKQCQSLYYGETVMKIEKRFPEPFSGPRWWWSGYGLVPQCFDCKHFKGLIQNQKRCSAFPDGIPDEIFKNSIQHNQPYPGDNGIRFEKYISPFEK